MCIRDSDVPITEEEFNKIVQSHPRVPVTLTPVAEYPVADTSPSGIGGKDVICASYREVFQRDVYKRQPYGRGGRAKRGRRGETRVQYPLSHLRRQLSQRESQGVVPIKKSFCDFAKYA